MDPQQSQDECTRLLKRRTERHANGGVGLLMGSDLVRSEPVDRPTRRRRGIAVALCLGVAALFTAGGFASAKIWDGYGTKFMGLEMAIQSARELGRKDLRESGVGRVFSFANVATQALVELRHDPVLKTSADRYLSALRRLLPERKSTGEAIQQALDQQLSVDDRKESLGRVKSAAWRALIAMREAAKDPQLSDEAVSYLTTLEATIEKALAEHR